MKKTGNIIRAIGIIGVGLDIVFTVIINGGIWELFLNPFNGITYAFIFLRDPVFWLFAALWVIGAVLSKNGTKSGETKQDVSS